MIIHCVLPTSHRRYVKVYDDIGKRFEKKEACMSKSHQPVVVVECKKCPTKQVIQTVSIVVVRRGINHTHNSLTRMWMAHLCLSLGNM